jgi:catechol 2,3-dioxygenase-like lactoylglutathione lyase family enzyme
VSAAAGLDGVLETSLYHDPDEAASVERFYTEILGLRLVSRWPGGFALRTGAGVLLLFDRSALAEREGPVSAHGTVGPGHACLLAREGAYDDWRDRLASAGVEVAHEHEWEGGRRSLYFSDPAGNLLEVASGDLWPA